MPVKSEKDIEIMREACRIAAAVLHQLADRVAPGVSTYELDQAGRELIESYGARSACHNYRVQGRRFPAFTCLSVNEEIVHGIGRPDRILQPGDEITVDVCVAYKGFIGDNARTVCVGPVNPDVERLVRSTEEALYVGIEQALPGNRVAHISGAVHRFVEARNFSVVRDFVGHGVGRSMHEEPQIPNYLDGSSRDYSFRLRPGMTLAIEPMVNMGGYAFDYAADGWTAVTRDRLPSAHFEHTVLITEDGPEILTRPPE